MSNSMRVGVELGVEGRALTSESDGDYVPNLSSLAQQDYDLIIGVGFLVGGAFYIAFGLANNFALALFVLAVAHMGGSILWVFSTVLLQSTVEDQFRGRVFAAEFTLMTLAMAAHVSA